jgi:hypothetical protein
MQHAREVGFGVYCDASKDARNIVSKERQEGRSARNKNGEVQFNCVPFEWIREIPCRYVNNKVVLKMDSPYMSDQLSAEVTGLSLFGNSLSRSG